MKKRILAGVFAAFMSLCLVGCNGGGTTSGNGSTGGSTGAIPQPTEVTNETYGSFWMRQHDYKTMPVAAFNALPPQLTGYTYNYIANESTYASYKEAGVNTMFGLSEYAGSAEVEQALDWCSDYGLSYLLPLGGAESFTSDSIAKSTLSRVKYHDAFGGIMQSDEPGRTYYEGIKRSADILDSVMPEEVTDALWHVNLFPTYAKQKQLYFRQYTEASVLPEGGYNYQQYVDDYMEICQPKVLSYDFYPCQGSYGNLSGGYFENMAIIREAALEANIPFWVYIQTCSFGGSSRVPDKQDILWQVNTALSYGAKGIQYFTGVLPQDTHEIFNGAMFDRAGNRTEIYDYVKEVNAQVAAVDEVLMCSVSKGVILSGDDSVGGADDIYPQDLLESYGGLTSMTALHAITGCFDHNGATALYITNNSVTEGDTVTLTLAKEGGYYVQGAVKKQFEGNTLTLTLDAAEGVLVVLSA